MKKLYLLLIALVCAVCANADSKTAVFDFGGNPWEHDLGYGTAPETQSLGNVDQLVADDNETTLTCVQGEASTPARLWQASPVQFRTYNKSSVDITAPAGITNIKVTATGSSYLFVPADFQSVEGVTNSKEVKLDGTEETYTITINGTTRWTRLEVTYEVADGPTGEPVLAETNVTDLSTLGNKKAYAFHALTGEGYWCYTPSVSETNVSICGVTDYSYQGSVGRTEWEAPFEVANPNHQWQILTFQDKRYIYNLGAKKYLALTNGTYAFTDTPTAMEFRVNAETETVDGKPELTLGGTFSIRPEGAGNLQYTCICTKNNNSPLKFWSYNDHGGPMLITEIENVSDDAAITALEEAVAQKERTDEWNALLAAAKAEYNGNSTFSEGEDIIKESSYFSSPYSCPKAKEPDSDITKLLDKDCKTYWHTDWSSEVAAHVHYLQVSLPDAIEGLTQLTMGRRDNKGSFCDNDNPVRMSVTFSADDVTYSEPTYFDTPFTQTIEDPYVKATFKVPAGTKYLRFYSEKNNGSLQRGYWHCGEFQLNPVTLDPTCVNAQNAEVAEDFGMILDEADEKDPATITDAHIAILKQALSTYHYETYLYTAAELNALESNVKAKAAEMEVVYVNGQYNYIQDETGMALLFDQNKKFTLQAGDKVKGLVVVGSPYNGLPEVKPLSEPEDLTITPNAEFSFEPAVATAVPTAEGANQIWKYTGVQIKSDATFTTTSYTNMTGVWQESELTFRNTYKHLTHEFKADTYYTIVAATAVYNGNVQLYVISAEEETSTVSVTYNVTFNGQTIKTETKTETVGQAPTFTLEAPAYVTVGTLPETITEETTEVTVTTNLNEQAPFQMQYTYFISVPNPNGAKEYWFNDNESGKLNELRGTEDGVKFEDLTDDSRWQIGGDWLNGFTLKNVKTGSYVAAGDNHDNGTNVKMGETAEKYTLVKNATGWRLSAEDTYLAHTSANSHIVSYWNVESYNASYVHFYRYEELTKYEQMLNLIDEAKEILDANHVVITGYDEDGYVEYTSLADKVGYKPEVILYDVVDSYDVETYFTEKEEVTDEASFNAAYIEAYSEFGEFWKDFGFDTPLDYELDYIQYAIDVYNAAAICMPEAGKYYTIRNANKFSSEEDGDKEYSYYFTTTTEGTLSLKSMLDATIEHEDIWQAGEYNYDEEEVRYTFQNVNTKTYLGYESGNTLTLLAEAGQSACFYLMGHGAEIPVYGTVGMQYYNGNNEYRWNTINMVKPGSYNAGNNPNFDNTYSSFVWIEEAEGFDPSTVGVGTVLAPTGSDKVFNLQGKLQNRLERGINIRNGKKVLR